ncbi:MAG: N-acetylmuramoyl-L-alanine amidase [Chloroflexi bacterium]|nr:N-acetylmuramoyl-L-alanine amidase [Chloroflexota bacterium]
MDARISVDGNDWSEWLHFTILDGLGGASFPIANLIFTNGDVRYIQYRATFSRPDRSVSPRLQAVTITYIDASQGPNIAEAKANVMVSPQVNAVNKPPIIPRAAWGADESYRFSSGTEVWPREYEYAAKLIIHHTVTSNDEPDPVATIRAIYYYHAVTLGWGDIGYNYLIDRFGNTYEGRYGGDNVMGGHALQYNRGSLGVAAMGTYASVAPSSQLEASLFSLASWQAFHTGINPNGSGFFVDKSLPNIMGHRDALQTTCPGDRLYVDVPTVRSQVWARLPDYGQAWRDYQVSGSANGGQLLSVTVTLGNAGRKTWVASGVNPFRLGYHWYDAQGNEYKDGTAQRLNLPSDVAPGGQVTLQGQVKAPMASGTYNLQLDMVQESVTWFAQRGNPTLNVPVTVQRPTLAVAWGTHDTPVKMALGETVPVKVDVTNTGSITWNAGSPNPFHLGYHWYDSQGNQYIQPPEDDHRNVLPGPVAPGQKVVVDALLTSPKAAGSYMLKWDMVQEGVTWFARPPYNNPTLNVAITVAPSVLTVAPATLAFEKLSDAPVPSQQMQVSNDGGGQMTWTATPSAAWIALSPTSGRAPAGVTASVKTDGLAAGSYSGKITVTGTVNGNTPITKDVPVTLVIGGLRATPGNLSFTIRGDIIPQEQKVQIENSLAGSINWRAEAGANWIKLGTTTGQTPATLEVGVDPSGLAAGLYQGEIRLYNTTSNNPVPVTVPVVLNMLDGWQRLYVPFIIDQKGAP